MIKTRHKGYMMLNRNFTIDEIFHNEYDVNYYTQINDNTLIFNRHSYLHYQATDEVLRYYYIDDINDKQIDERYIVESKNEFLFVFFDYDYDYPPVEPNQVDSVSIWLPYSIEIYSEEQISFLEEVIDTCKNFRYIEIRENRTTRDIDEHLSWNDPTSRKVEVLRQIASLARIEKDKQKIRKKEI